MFLLNLGLIMGCCTAAGFILGRRPAAVVDSDNPQPIEAEHADWSDVDDLIDADE